MGKNRVAVCFLLVLLAVSFIFAFVETQRQNVQAQNVSPSSGVAPSSSPGIAWQKTFSPANWTGAHNKAYSLIQTNDGGYAVAGTYNDTIYLGKLSASGTLEWSRTYGEGGATAVVQTNAGEYVLACDAGYSSYGLMMYEDGYVMDTSRGAIVLLKVDSSGTLLWNQTLVPSSGAQTNFMAVTSLVKTSDGGYAVGGFADNLTASIDYLIVKADSQGKVQWVKTYGGPVYDEAYSIMQTWDGGYALVGYTGSFGQYNNNFWLVKTDADGNLQWTQTYGSDGLGHRGTAGSNNGYDYGQGDSRARSAVQTSDEGYALVGYTSTNMSKYIWLVKTDSRGVIQWNRTFGDGEPRNAYSVVQTSDGGFAVAWSNRTNIVNGPLQIVLSKTDSSGNMQWTQTYAFIWYGIYQPTYPESAYAEPSIVIQTRDGGLAVLGSVGDLYSGFNFFLWKTLPFLPLPSPTTTRTPAPSQPPTQPPQLAFPAITIHEDGSVTPSSAPIVRSGNLYKMTGNFSGSLVVAKNNVVVDGAGYTLQGNGSLAQPDGTSTFIQITKYGVVLSDRTNVTVRNLQTFGYMIGFYLEGDCRGNLIEGNMITGDTGTGISIYGNATANQITRNIIRGCENSLYMFNSSFNVISGNTLTGAKMGGTTSANGINDTFTQNLFGLRLEFYYSSGANLTGNTFQISGYGSAVAGVTGGFISQNNFTNNYCALSDISFCTVTGNSFQNNSQALVNARNCTFYLNSFINNTISTANYPWGGASRQPMSPNIWDNGIRGNYWSNYTGTDANHDGIGDTPYPIDANNQDSRPLVSPTNLTFAAPNPNFPAPSPSQTPGPSPTPTLIGEFQTWIILPLCMSAAVVGVLSLMLAKRKARIS